MIYLDNAASTPVYKEVANSMDEVLRNVYGNPSSIHKQGREAKVIIEDSRKSIAGFLNADPSEIYFTSGGTEALNIALNGMAPHVKTIITSSIEHPAVSKTLEQIAKSYKLEVKFLRIDEKGHPDLNQLEYFLSESDNNLVCLMHANNEIGNLLPINQVKKICKKFNSLFLSDTVQTMGKFYNDLENLGLDFATCSGHKFHGPKGSGFLYINKKCKIKPLLHGGGQERNMRAGTENVYCIAGLAKAFELAYQELDKDIEYITKLKGYFIKRLKTEIDGIVFNGDCEEAGLHTIINVSLPDNNTSGALHLNLDIEGIAVSAGSACASGSIRTSHVMKAIGADTKRPVIRFSLSKFNTKEEIDIVIEKLKCLLYN